MSIDKAAKATRRYCVEHHREWSGKTNNGLNFGILIGLGWRWLATSGEAQAACDRLNLLAVLKSILAMDRPFSREFTRDLEALIGEAEAQ